MSGREGADAPMEQRQNGMRQPPYSADAERSVLGSMLLETNALEIAIEQLRPEDFYLSAHEAVFACMRDIRNGGGAVDLVTLVNELERHGKLDMAGGAAYLSELLSFVPTAANVQDYIAIVEEKSVRRQLMHAGSETIRESCDDGNDLERVLDSAERRIYDISMRKAEDSLVPVSEVVPEAFAEIGELMNRQGRLTGVDTGFADLNRMTNGLQKSDLIVVAARPAMGKTAFALNIAQHAALRDGRTVVIFSLEMSKQQLVMRMLCSEASVEAQRIKEGVVDPEDTERLMQVMEPISRCKLHIDDTGGISVPEIRSKCRRLKARRGLDLVVIDYLQLMQPSGGARRSDSRTQEVSDMTRQLKLLARELEVPVVLLAQLNRGPETRQDHTPMIADLRESGSIEQDADMVILLYRPAVYDETEDNTSQAIVAKHRHGPTGTVMLVWQGEYTRFLNLAPEPA